MTVQDDESRYPRPVRNDPVVRVIHKLWSTTVPTARASIVWMISEFQFKDGKIGRWFLILCYCIPVQLSHCALTLFFFRPFLSLFRNQTFCTRRLATIGQIV